MAGVATSKPTNIIGKETIGVEAQRIAWEGTSANALFEPMREQRAMMQAQEPMFFMLWKISINAR